VQHAVLAEADLHLLAPRVALHVDVRDALRPGLDDHVVDEPHERVVRLLDRLVVVQADALRALALERLDQLVNELLLGVR
jgi:hypothetical protein